MLVRNIFLIVAGMLPGDQIVAEWRLLGAGPGGRTVWPEALGFELTVPADPVSPSLVLENGRGQRLPAGTEVLSRWESGAPRVCRLIVGEIPGTTKQLRLRESRTPHAKLAKLDVVQAAPRLQLRSGNTEVSWTPQGLQFGSKHRFLEWPIITSGVLVLDGVTAQLQVAVPLRWEAYGDAGGAYVGQYQCIDSDGRVLPGRVHLEIQCSTRLRILAVELALIAESALSLRRWTLPCQLRGPFAVTLASQRLEVPVGGELQLMAGRQLWEVLGTEESCLPPSGRDPGTLWWTAGNGTAELGMGWLQFGYRRPAKLVLRSDGRSTIELAPEPIALARGQVLRHRFRLWSGNRVDPQPILAVPHPPTGPKDPALRQWFQTWCTFLQTWMNSVPFVEDHGCYLTAWGTFANNEYDLAGSLIDLGRRWQDGTALALGCRMAQHTRDWDRAASDEWPWGLLSTHGVQHASDRVELGHQWLDGFGRSVQQSGAVTMESARRHLHAGLVAAVNQGQGLQGPERCLAWPLRATWDAAQVRDSAAEQGLAQRLVDLLIARQSEDGWLMGDQRQHANTTVHWNNTWVSLGITVDALLRVHDRWQTAGAKECAVRLSDFYLTHALRDHTLAQVVTVDPESNETHRAGGFCRRGNAALAAAGLWRYQRSVGIDDHRDLFDELWATALRDLAEPNDKFFVEFAKTLQALRSLHSCGYFRAEE